MKEHENITSFPESKDRGEEEKKLNDGLDFDCEVCSDREGGCPQCGFGRDQEKAI